MLYVDRYGPEDGRPLLIAHGLFGSARNWASLARKLAEARPVHVVDMRNHGASPWNDRHDYPAMAEDLAEVARPGPVDLLGHSMGGKAAMALALSRPERVARLVVADIAPVAYTHSQLHLVEAMAALDLTGLTRRAEADARLAETVPDKGVRAFLLQSLDLGAEPPRWRLNLAALADQMPAILDWPEALAGPFEGPTLFLSGAASDYVRHEHRAQIRALFPAARFAKIPLAGHWLHADRPEAFAAAVTAFLDAA